MSFASKAAMIASVLFMAGSAHAADYGSAGSKASLVSFDGAHALSGIAQRQGMPSQVIDFKLKVDVQGTPTDCELSREFRRKIVGISLCRALMKHHTLAPARDEEGNAVEGIYASRIDFRTWLLSDGTIDRNAAFGN